MEQSNIAAISAVEHTVGIVAAYVGRNTIAPSDLPKIIGEVHRAVVALDAAPEEPAAELVPAVPVKSRSSRLHRLPGRWAQIQVAQASHRRARHDAGAVPRQVEPAGRLSPRLPVLQR